MQGRRTVTAPCPVAPLSSAARACLSRSALSCSSRASWTPDTLPAVVPSDIILARFPAGRSSRLGRLAGPADMNSTLNACMPDSALCGLCDEGMARQMRCGAVQVGQASTGPQQAVHPFSLDWHCCEGCCRGTHLAEGERVLGWLVAAEADLHLSRCRSAEPLLASCRGCHACQAAWEAMGLGYRASLAGAAGWHLGCCTRQGPAVAPGPGCHASLAAAVGSHLGCHACPTAEVGTSQGCPLSRSAVCLRLPGRCWSSPCC